jgi:hypothetical protein
MLDNWRLWVTVAIVIVLIAYGPYFLTYQPNFVSTGFTPGGVPLP